MPVFEICDGAWEVYRQADAVYIFTSEKSEEDIRLISFSGINSKNALEALRRWAKDGRVHTAFLARLQLSDPEAYETYIAPLRREVPTNGDA